MMHLQFAGVANSALSSIEITVPDFTGGSWLIVLSIIIFIAIVGFTEARRGLKVFAGALSATFFIFAIVYFLGAEERNYDEWWSDNKQASVVQSLKAMTGGEVSHFTKSELKELMEGERVIKEEWVFLAASSRVEDGRSLKVYGTPQESGELLTHVAKPNSKSAATEAALITLLTSLLITAVAAVAIHLAVRNGVTLRFVSFLMLGVVSASAIVNTHGAVNSWEEKTAAHEEYVEAVMATDPSYDFTEDKALFKLGMLEKSTGEWRVIERRWPNRLLHWEISESKAKKPTVNPSVQELINGLTDEELEVHLRERERVNP